LILFQDFASEEFCFILYIYCLIKSVFLVLELDQAKEVKRNKKKMSKSSLVFEKQSELMCGHHELIDLSSDESSTSPTSFEDDEQESKEDLNLSEEDILDYDLSSPITSARSKFNTLKQPPVAPRSSHQINACDTQRNVGHVL
jgi:hypothetical protein